MSVFTTLERDDIGGFLAPFPTGALLDFSGIPAGSENTNYFVGCESGEYVLTLVERGPIQDLPFLIDLLDCLHQHQLPVPYAIADIGGKKLHRLKNRPALLQPRLSGKHVLHPDTKQCAAVGSMLARLHNSTRDSRLTRTGDRGPLWTLNSARSLLDSHWQHHRSWLLSVLESIEQQLSPAPPLPVAIIHGDLFRDNVLFDGPHISGLIDFYNAATGWTLLDLAICVNDWCVDESPASGELSLDSDRVTAMLDAWRAQHPMTEAEQQCWPMMLQLAALRFWVSRQQYLDQHPAKPEVLIKDPEHFCKVLQLHC